MRIGIVAGLPQELAAFAPNAPGETRLRNGPIVRATHFAGHEILLCCAGIGKVAAGTAASLLCAGFDVELLMTIGVAGLIGGGRGAAFNVVEAVQSDYGARRPECFARYSPGTLPIGPEICKPFVALDVPGLDLPKARIASADMFVESEAHAAEIGASLGATLIDMETAAVAQVASLLGLPWVAVKATTDAAGEDSAELFEANLLAAADAAARGAERLLTLL